MGIMTVRENLMFSAQLRLPVSIPKNEKQVRPFVTAVLAWV